MSNNSEWFEKSRSRWEQIQDKNAFRRGYWAISYKIEPVNGPVSFQQVRNAFVIEGKNNLPFFVAPQPEEQGDIIEKAIGKTNHLQWWCASRVGEVFLVQPYTEDKDAPGTFVYAAKMVRAIRDVLLHAKRLATHFANDANKIHLHLVWTGLVGRELHANGSFDPLGDTATDNARTPIVLLSFAPDSWDSLAIYNLTKPFFDAFHYEPSLGLMSEWLQ
jgi:hypothetical protein